MPQDHLRAIGRRDFLKLSGSAAVSAAVPGVSIAGVPSQKQATAQAAAAAGADYATLLKTWCDALLAHQLEVADPALSGGLLCPACALIHGRCGEAVYPLLRVAHTTGDQRYVRAAQRVHEWSERQVSRADGSWVNDVTLSSWQGITVFHSIALAEALHHHGALLDASTRQSWTDRLAKAAKFLDGFITMATGNINYPVTSSLAFTLCGQVLGNPRYLERGRQMAHAGLEYFTENGLLFGEGHPQQRITPKGCRPVDLGYNVEESLPALAMYAAITNDQQVRAATVRAMRAQMEFMLPDGAWDNSWGTRNYKWSWWGSRTTDGCHPGYVLLAGDEPRFREVARRSLELMAACTHNGLLYGGPDYQAHGDLPCIHHSFTHAKALAAVLDRGGADPLPAKRLTLPRDEAYGLRSFPAIGTHLAAVGEWRATVTEYDCDYEEHAAPGGGHVSGGSLALLYHRALGPVLVSSMTEYRMVEPTNQQAYRNSDHMPLTARIETEDGRLRYTSMADYEAHLAVERPAVERPAGERSDADLVFTATGRLLTAARQGPPEGELRYQLQYRIGAAAIEITAQVEPGATPPGRLRFILPLVCRAAEEVEQADAATVHLSRAAGRLTVRTSAPGGFEAVPTERTFNLVPGFECVPLTVSMQPGRAIGIRLEAV